MTGRARLVALLASLATWPAAAATCNIPVAMPFALLQVAQGPVLPPAGDLIAGGERLAAAGRLAEARVSLLRALERSEIAPPRRALGWAIVALAAAVEGEPADAQAAVVRARGILRPDSDAYTAALAQIYLGWALTELGNVPETRQAFDAAADLASKAGHALLLATARTHRALLEGRIGGDVGTHARRAAEAIDAIADDSQRARLRVALGLALVPETRRARTGPNDALARSMLGAAYDDASKARDARSLSQALGLMGELQLLRGENAAAVASLRRAVAAARAQSDDPWRYRWSWKLGIALKRSGDAQASLASLMESVDLVEAAKARSSLDRFSASSLARGYRGAYFDLADALLSPTADAESLSRARYVMELSRAADIGDYFRDPCLTERSARVAEPYQLDPSAVLIHPLVLEDRIEMLVSHRSGIARFTSRIDSVSVAREVQRFRVAAEHPGSDRYLPMAQALHGWLVAPMAAHLERIGVSTLVWVPDGPLRGVPFAALHDGKSHLIERYAVAVTPVATLTDPRPLGATALRANLWGLTVASQGFAALPGVGAELDRVSRLLDVPARRDEAFSVDALQDALRRSPVNTLHIASHGQFAPEAGQTFLLAYDGRFTLPQLRAALAAGKIREEPVELLVLSACQTAAGDERAALGIAGVAIGAGARSAVATLWSVSDASTALLVERFYRELAARQSNRAQALRTAQLSLLREPATAHPFYWAPFLVIGNWM